MSGGVCTLFARFFTVLHGIPMSTASKTDPSTWENHVIVKYDEIYMGIPCGEGLLQKRTNLT